MLEQFTKVLTSIYTVKTLGIRLVLVPYFILFISFADFLLVYKCLPRYFLGPAKVEYENVKKPGMDTESKLGKIINGKLAG